MNKKRVLSGIRASGRLHLGNYLGAVKGMLKLQDDSNYETFFMVADLHALTTPHSVEELRKNRREVVLDYLAAGLNPEKSVIFEQSDSVHAELAFYLSSLVTVARMQHLPTYKEKVKQYPQNVTMALLNYPVLMAADILAYKANAVPAGDDQIPHLEVAREIARKLNEQYKTRFPEPEQFKTEGHYVPSLTGDGKMSKSIEGSYINLTDNLEAIKLKIAKIPTDSGKAGMNDSASGNNFQNIMTFVELFEGKEKRKEYEAQYNGKGIIYSELKNNLAQAIYNELKIIQEKREELESKPKFINEVINEGGKKARKIAEETILELRLAMGLK